MPLLKVLDAYTAHRQLVHMALACRCCWHYPIMLLACSHMGAVPQRRDCLYVAATWADTALMSAAQLLCAVIKELVCAVARQAQVPCVTSLLSVECVQHGTRFNGSNDCMSGRVTGRLHPQPPAVHAQLHKKACCMEKKVRWHPMYCGFHPSLQPHREA